MDMTINNHSNGTHLTAEKASARTARQRREDGNREAVAVPSNTATNNSNKQELIKILRYGVDSLYLSYQGVLFDSVDEKLTKLKLLARSEYQEQKSKAQYKIGDHLFEVKDKGTSMFAYILEDNAFRIQLSRPNKSVPMAYVKISSEYLTYKSPEDAEKRLNELLSELGVLQSTANVSRIDLYVDFVSYQNMEAWTREAWVTRAGSVNAYAIDKHFTGWAVGMGGVIAARLYDKLYEICKSNKGYLIPLWEMAGRSEGEPIWRLEFEFKRDFLKQKAIFPLKEVLAHLNGIWSYATTEWLKLTIPNDADETRARWPVHPMWQLLASIDWETNGSPLKNRFTNQRLPDPESTLDRAVSAFTTWMAANANDDPYTAFQTFFDVLSYHIHEKARRLDMPLEDFIMSKVSPKARLFNTLNTNPEEEYLSFNSEAYRRASDGE
jgi:hypothetical protein